MTRHRAAPVVASLVAVLVLVLSGSPAFAVDRPINGGFEERATGWEIYSDDGHDDAARVVAGGHTGTRRLTHRANEAYHVETTQLLTALFDAKFTLSVWVRSSGGQNDAYITMRGCGAKPPRTALPTTDTWQLISVSVEVSTGRCNIALVSDGPADTWADFDDVALSATDGGKVVPAPPITTVAPWRPSSDAQASRDATSSFAFPGSLVTLAGAVALILVIATIMIVVRRRTLQPDTAVEATLQRGEERQRRMVADVAHELRTPLSTVRSHLEALIDGVLPANPEVFASLHEEALLQQRIVDDLQDLTLAETGKMTYHRDDLEAGELLRSCATALALRADAAGVRLTVDEAVPGQINGDPDRLRQVIGNLVGNALRYTPAGGSVTLRCDRSSQADDSGHGLGIRARTRRADVVVIAIIDTGSGIAPDQLPHVFDRFWRSDAARGHAAGGTGLGLAIAQQIIADHGGTISVRSRLGVGTTFTVRLPAVVGAPGGRHRSSVRRDRNG